MFGIKSMLLFSFQVCYVNLFLTLFICLIFLSSTKMAGRLKTHPDSFKVEITNLKREREVMSSIL